MLPAGYSAGTTVHEYGGGAFAVAPDGNIIFNDAKKRAVFCLQPASGEVTTVISRDEDVRYADFHCHPESMWMLAVQEDHTKETIENSIVAIDRTNGKVVSIASGADFYQHPQFSGDGSKVCWVQWSHPHMSWRGTRLFVADWHSDSIGEVRHIAGEEGKISVAEARWGFDGILYFMSDETGWWQLHRLTPGSSEPERIKLKGLEEVDLGNRGGALGACTWHPLTAETLVVTVTSKATQSLITVRPAESLYSTLTNDLSYWEKEAFARLSDTEFVIIGCSRRSADAAYVIDTERDASTTLRTTLPLDKFPGLSTEHISIAKPIEFPRTYGDFREGLAYAFYTAPKNPSFVAPQGSKPPCIIWCHGGPHHFYGSGLNLVAQYFTSRGYAYVGVNHAGSIGYGRAYRELLYGNWGVVDGADCASCVKYLADQGLIDPKRVGIVGQSAGGYAVLQGLCEYPDVYAGGVSNYGISSLEALMIDTHKFESHYCQELIFKRGMTEEEQKEILRRRSPYLNAEKIKAPLLLLQGDADRVVPPNQTLMMEEVMRKGERQVEVVMFNGEGHGFKRKESIKASLELQEDWWKQTLLKDS